MSDNTSNASNNLPLCQNETSSERCATTTLSKQTALHFAVQRKDEKMVEILVRNPSVKKKLVNITDNNNETALSIV